MNPLVSGEVYGVREALQILRQSEEKVYWRAVHHIKSAGAEMVDVVAKAHPPTAEVKMQMRGWSQKGRLGYDFVRIKRSIGIKVGGRRDKSGNRPLVTLVEMNPGGALFALAGMNRGNSGKPYGPDRLGRRRVPAQSKAFLSALSTAFGPAQRAGWRHREELKRLGEERIVAACEDVAQWANRKLVR